MPPFNSLVRWAGVTNVDDMRLLYLTFIQRYVENSMAQVAIITASDSGIGKECALLLAQQGF